MRSTAPLRSPGRGRLRHGAGVMSACHNSLGRPAASRRHDGPGILDGLAGLPRAGMRPARFRLERRLALGEIPATVFTTQAPLAPRFRSSKARGDQQCRSTPRRVGPTGRPAHQRGKTAGSLLAAVRDKAHRGGYAFAPDHWVGSIPRLLLQDQPPSLLWIKPIAIYPIVHQRRAARLRRRRNESLFGAPGVDGGCAPGACGQGSGPQAGLHWLLCRLPSTGVTEGRTGGMPEGEQPDDETTAP